MHSTYLKNKRHRFLFFLALVTLATLTAAPSHAIGLRLIYGNDNLGELDGCG